MPDEWNLDEIKRVAATSGKPLEVECAMAFRQSKAVPGWRVLLSTYYVDTMFDVVRELDGLAERVTNVVGSGGANAQIGVRALVVASPFWWKMQGATSGLAA